MDGSLGQFSALNGQVRAITSSIELGATSDVGVNSSLELAFSVDAANTFTLSGAIDTVGPTNRNNASLYFYSVDGTGDHLLNIYFVNGTFSSQYFLNAGNYKLVGYANSSSTGNEAAFGTLDFKMQAVPEPTTMAVLGMGLVVALKRKKK